MFNNSVILSNIMKHMPTLNELERTCSKCGVKLTSFIAYIPGKGETCMKCYMEYAQKKENEQ